MRRGKQRQVVTEAAHLALSYASPRALTLAQRRT
jgi:hypothetical protein